MFNFKGIIYRPALLGVVLLQLCFSIFIYAADAPIGETFRANQIDKLRQEMTACVKEKDYAGAQEKCELIKQKFPESFGALEAQLDIAVACINSSDFIRAQKASELFLTEF